MRNNLLQYLLCVVMVLVILAPAPVYAGGLAEDSADEPVIKITQLDTSKFPLVTAYVSITDTRGEPLIVNGENLVIRENGQVIKPESIQGIGETGPLTTMLAIDVSGSMLTGDKLKIAKNVAADYVKNMAENDQAGIITFNETVQYFQEITAEQDTLQASIEEIQAAGDTAMYDAAMEAVKILNPLPGRKAVILLTDGMDNRSASKLDEVVEAIGQQGLTISTVGFGDPNQGTGNLTALDEKALLKLAEEAGGQYGYAEDEAALREIYDRYNRLMRSEYAVSFTSPSALRDGLRRSLTVTLGENSKAGGFGLVESSYNPGGLVPEVGGDAPWLMFFLLLGLLVAVLFIPQGIRLYRQKMPKKSRVKLVTPEKPTRVKLK